MHASILVRSSVLISTVQCFKLCSAPSHSSNCRKSTKIYLQPFECTNLKILTSCQILILFPVADHGFVLILGACQFLAKSKFEVVKLGVTSPMGGSFPPKVVTHHLGVVSHHPYYGDLLTSKSPPKGGDLTPKGGDIPPLGVEFPRKPQVGW